jgi:NAD(P)-dependent dehydrogenase (short-subunit alcohol dehydrogenase family)
MTDKQTPIALITGGSRGLGRNMALALAAQGTDVILTYHSKQDEAAKVVVEIENQGRKAHALQLAVGNVDTFDEFVSHVRKALVDHWQRDTFNFLVNNAGSALHASFAETSEDDFDRVVNEHFKGPFFLTQKLLPLLADGGRIVNISSGLARFSLPGSSAYAAVKGAMEVLTRYQAKELGERRIASNVVAPGAIATDFSGGMVRDNPEVNKQVAGSTALGRVGEPEDIGGVVAALLSPACRWINAQRIEVSGGTLI